MIEKLSSEFHTVDRDVKALSLLLATIVSGILMAAAYYIFHRRIAAAIVLLAPLAASTAALVVSRVATRLIMSNKIDRENDRRLDVVRVTHHLIVVSQDLLAKVAYAKKVLGEPAYPLITFQKLVIGIESRYETLMEREAYQHLPGGLVSLIGAMSGSIFGLGTVAKGTEILTEKDPMALVGTRYRDGFKPIFDSMEQLEKDIEKVIAGLYALRASLDQQPSETPKNPVKRLWNGVRSVTASAPAAASTPKSEPS